MTLRAGNLVTKLSVFVQAVANVSGLDRGNWWLGTVDYPTTLGHGSGGMMTNSAISELPAKNLTSTRDIHAHRTARPRKPVSRPSGRARSRRRSSVFPKIFTIAVVFALSIGWLNRDDNGLTPESGVGYWFGIVGGSLMLLLLLYPLRKRVRTFRVIGTVTFWFRAHMILGIVGPVLVLWHANFRLGSINSSVALIAMLIVATSGVIGRYLYSKIHLGLYGRKAKVEQVVANADDLRKFILAHPSISDRMAAKLNTFAQHVAAGPKGPFAGLISLPIINLRAAILRKQLIAYAQHVISVEGKRRGRPQHIQRLQLEGTTEFVTRHIGAAKKAATFAFYERLFGLWHLFHVPLFFFLVITAIVHVFASHFY
jgi:hypothetical protein